MLFLEISDQLVRDSWWYILVKIFINCYINLQITKWEKVHVLLEKGIHNDSADH